MVDAQPEPPELLGEWTLTRKVQDELAGLQGEAAGRLTLAAAGGRIRWREHGILEWNGSRLPFTRGYEFRRTHGEWWLHFADGRPFHVWRPGESVLHPCGPDEYQGRITATGPDAWHTHWELRGPDTAQLIVTDFARLAAPSR